MTTFSYRDAVKLMGASEHKAVAVLDKLLGGTLLAGSALGIPDVLSWFDAKADFIRFSHEYAVKLSEKRSGISRYDRTQRLHAAHTVIVLASFFEAFDGLGVPTNTRELELKHDRIVPKVPVELVGLATSPVPLVTPERPYEDNLSTLVAYYTGLTSGLGSFLSGLAVWDDMDDRQRGLLDELPAVACRRYEENIRRFAVDCPEFAFWSSSQDHQATRVVVRTALAEVERLFATLTVGNTPQQRRAELAHWYHSVLDSPIIAPGEVPDGLTIPLFRDCYIDPRFQVGHPSSPAQTHSWEPLPVRTDVHDFFVGYLTSPKATQVPLLVLGDPGSGKSVLTKVLSARLPATDFLPLRVELRTAPTEADLVQQIEHSLRGVLDEPVTWADFARSTDGALPVVFLDGFDELLQATGVSQTNYLRKIEQFQRDSAAKLRPVAVIVTSRISVADRATIPDQSTIMRLAPFDAEQTGRWIQAWNKANPTPLDVSTVLAYPELAEQPLLLLMLALYNALQPLSGTISEAELYERLLVNFARREIDKDGEERSSDQIDDAVEGELLRLSVVALAMFNRGTQWIREPELDRDLTALLGEQPERTGTRRPLGAGEAVLGRFFFIQRGQAVRDDRVLRTYEFLHATFSEYLVARFAWRTLENLLHSEKSASRLNRSRAVDDSELYSLLSFAPLSSRQPVIRFLDGLAGQSAIRADLAAMLLRIFHTAMRHRDKTDYEPIAFHMPSRYAFYSANIVMLAVITHGELPASDLFGPEDVPADWNRQSLLWKSQIVGAEWQGLVDAIHLARVWRGDKRDLVLRLPQRDDQIPEPDISWLLDIPPRAQTDGWYYLSHNEDAHFLCDPVIDYYRHSLAPAESIASETLAIFRTRGTNTSPVHAMLELLFDRAEANTRESGLWEALEDWDLTARLLRSSAHYDAVVPPDTLGSAMGVEMTTLLFDRVGRGGDDDMLTEAVNLPSIIWGVEQIDIAALDAALRLAEGGGDADLLDLDHVWSQVDRDKITLSRPDLVKRLHNVAREQGWEA